MPRQRVETLLMTKDMYDDLVEWGKSDAHMPGQFNDAGDWDKALQNTRRRCERCGKTGGVRLEDARTNYVREPPTVWQRIQAADGGLTPSMMDDPNKPLALCRACAKEHHDYWDERWNEYYDGVL